MGQEESDLIVEESFSLSKIIGLGALYGLVMRVFMGLPPFGDYVHAETMRGATGAMLASFAVLVPAIIGAWTFSRLPKEKQTFLTSLYIGAMPTACFVAGTALLLIEGSICIAMASPLFLICSTIGGLSMWLLLKVIDVSRFNTNAMLLLPLLIAPLEMRANLPDGIQTVQRSIDINANPQAVWYLINHATNIQASEFDGVWAYEIGVPSPLEAITEETSDGHVRKLKWTKGVTFDEPILDWQENRYIRWAYGFTPETFPKDALDEHVQIGGKYFDLIDTSYTLSPSSKGTKLDIQVTYRVSTNFNWYANPMGKFLINDTAEHILLFYKNRAEKV